MKRKKLKRTPLKVGDRVRWLSGYNMKGSIKGINFSRSQQLVLLVKLDDGPEVVHPPSEFVRLVPKKKPASTPARREWRISFLAGSGNVAAGPPMYRKGTARAVELRSGEMIVTEEMLAKAWDNCVARGLSPDPIQEERARNRFFQSLKERA